MLGKGIVVLNSANLIDSNVVFMSMRLHNGLKAFPKEFNDPVLNSKQLSFHEIIMKNFLPSFYEKSKKFLVSLNCIEIKNAHLEMISTQCPFGICD